MDKYYKYEDKIVNSFLFVPKFLFSDERFMKLSVTEKLIYSLYLHRYTISQYHDEIGRYIIFTDDDVVDKLYITSRTCIRARKKLEEANLIKIQKTLTYNKIYLVNVLKASESEHFFNENDLEGLKFYQFPREFFEDTYKNLTLNAKMVYTVFLDTLTLSQMNYFVDSNKRIYFQENMDIQIKKLNLTKPTIREARYLLMVCGLLLEYKTFTEDIRYYPLKLSHYTDRTAEYKKCKTAKEKKAFIEKTTKQDKDELILNPLKIGVKLHDYRKDAGLTQTRLISLLREKNVDITQQTYSSYENGKLHIKKELYDICLECIQDEKKKMSEYTIPKENIVINDNPKEKNCHDIQDKNKEMSVEEEKLVTNEKKELTSPERKESHINYTYTNKTENNYNEKLIELINYINNIINTSHILLEEKDYLTACFDKLRIYKRFYLNTSQELFTTERLYEILQKMNEKNKVEEVCLKILDRIETSHYQFKTPDSAINCFITFLLNELKVEEKQADDVPEWFSKKKFQFNRLPERKIEVSDEIKDYKWWEE